MKKLIRFLLALMATPVALIAMLATYTIEWLKDNPDFGYYWEFWSWYVEWLTFK